MTIDQIMKEIENRVIKDQPISAGSWVESAIRVNALVGSLDSEIARYEALMVNIEAEYLKAEKSAVASKILAKTEIDFEDYLKKKAKREQIDEFIRLAKKRSTINEI